MGRHKVFAATVISDKMQKTRVVRVTRMTKHPKYHKVVKQYETYKAHDEKNESKAGDRVRIVETRPLSKDKRFVIEKIVQRAVVVHSVDEGAAAEGMK
jgi:small subunit ribosomal protein S17